MSTLDLEPDDQVLEIGCGHGVAVTLVCEHLVGGSITAIDRSSKMIELATRRNRQFVTDGKATFQTAALTEAEFGDARFNKIFAVHVGNLLTKEPARNLGIIKELLTPDGAFFIIQEPPNLASTKKIAEETAAILREHGFSIKHVRFNDPAKPSAVCVAAGAVDEEVRTGYANF